MTAISLPLSTQPQRARQQMRRPPGDPAPLSSKHSNAARHYTRPAALGGPLGRADRRSGRACQPSVRAHRSSAPTASRAPRSLRLTRRGRLLITGLLFTAGVLATLFSGAVSLASTHPDRTPVRYITVAPGQTLWSIAGEVAPDEDRRDTVQRIVELNALDATRLFVGQRVAVPSGP